MKEPAHKILINRYLSWDLVNERLDRYNHIGTFYSIDNLRSCSRKAPFYCHYMAWRLGTWQDESLFEFFEALLENASKLKNWNVTKIPQGCEFENFWSFLWELQVAQLFSNYPKLSIEWKDSGPDLKITTGEEEFFVECTIYRKSFGLEEFINELLSHVHPTIKAKHSPFIDYSLPNNAIEPFLDELFQPLIDTSFIQEVIRKSVEISPIQLPEIKSVRNFFVFVENENARNFDTNKPWILTGLPEHFLGKTIQEILEKKGGSNKLKSHRPNLLAVNLLLGVDFQLAATLRSIPKPDLGSNFDALFMAVCGINEIPSLGNRALFFHNNHPIKGLINS